jgi:alginate O-acetyltransferase complex protein AlgI
MVTGFFLKMVCADNLATFVNAHWLEGAQPGAGAATALPLALAFSGQIFADFAGYSNISRGIGMILGFRFPLNFNAPYIATTFREFWLRWHITLSRWLRDYLYIPLGGNRASRARTQVNLLIVMLLGGLWHGAAYRFIVWGGLHGGALAVERGLGLDRGRRGPWLTAAWFVVVQVVVLCAWVFFRTPALGDGIRFVMNLFTPGGQLPGWTGAGVAFLLPLVVHHLWVAGREHRRVRPVGVVGRVVLAGLMLLAIATISGGTSDFLYFQF